MTRTRVVLVGAGFIAEIQAECYARFVPEAEIVAVWSRHGARAEAFAGKHGIPRWLTDLDEALTYPGCEVVDICIPNQLHARATVAAARAGKHVIIEKPLCLTLEEADAMIGACKAGGRKLMYAEELCFAPKYERVRSLVGEGALGSIYHLRQSEKHSGPHSDWFYDIMQSGGGALMDMGCHGFAWFRWMLGGRPVVTSVQAHMQRGLIHGGRTRGEENSVCIVEFEGGAIGVVENSWAKLGGMEDRVDVWGSGGVIHADLFMGNSALTFSEKGYGYAMEKAGGTQGWTFTTHEEAFNQGYPHELKHFIGCVRDGSEPITTGDDGRAVLELLYAAYYSARVGRKVTLAEVVHRKVSKPIDLWLGEQE